MQMKNGNSISVGYMELQAVLLLGKSISWQLAIWHTMTCYSYLKMIR